jgi:two-component system, NarL family, nitrate/nitrite response regulator NarL
MPTSVFIIGEIRLYREGLASSLTSLGFTVTGGAAGAPEALESLSERGGDVVLIDMASADATEVSRAIAERFPTTSIVALAIPEVESYVVACAEAGISSYVAREASLADLAAAIDAAGQGEAYCSPQIAGALLRHVRVLAVRRGVEHPELPALTFRQREILALVDEGLSNKEISQLLHIEIATVKNHVHNILDKLQVHRRSEAAARVRTRR